MAHTLYISRSISSCIYISCYCCLYMYVAHACVDMLAYVWTHVCMWNTCIVVLKHVEACCWYRGSSSILFKEARSLSQTRSSVTWLVVLATLLWGFSATALGGWKISQVTMPTWHLCEFRDLNCPHTCVDRVLTTETFPQSCINPSNVECCQQDGERARLRLPFFNYF